MKSVDEKQLLLDQLKKTPIIQIACEKTGVSRASYYRWCKENPEFKKQSEESITQGNLLINDLAESQLLSAIKDKNMTAIIFWLKNHHPDYTTKIQINPSRQDLSEILTEEDEEVLKKALSFAGLIKKEGDPNGNAKQ